MTSTFALMVGLVVAITLDVAMVSIAQDEDYVECKDQQEYCECDKNQPICKFRLEIEELQTFTSYKINTQDGDLMTRGTPGDIYFINESGIYPSVSGVPREAPEYGSCWEDYISIA